MNKKKACQHASRIGDGLGGSLLVFALCGGIVAATESHNLLWRRVRDPANAEPLARARQEAAWRFDALPDKVAVVQRVGGA